MIKISFANDHSGFPLRGDVLGILADLGAEVIDHGSVSPDRVDFPDLARKVCASILNGEADRGLMLCGTGVGAAIGANKFPGIRACVCHDVHSAHQAVEHDNLNVLCLGAKIIGPWLARDLIQAYLGAHFSDDPYFRRRDRKLAALEIEVARRTAADPGGPIDNR